MPHRRTSSILSGLAAIVLVVLGLLCVPASARAFPDVPVGHPYATAIDELHSRRIIGGYLNGDFGLKDAVKRAQFAKMVTGALDITPGSSTATRFTDLGAPDANGYPHTYVQAAYANGITYGTNQAQTLFAPWDSIRRDQMVSMIVRGIKSLHPGVLEDPPPRKTGLYSDVGEPHGENLRLADNNGLLDGIINILDWNIYDTATRGEVAQMLWNLLILLDEDEPPTPTEVWVYANGTGDYPTLQAAVAGVAPGSTIHLGPGTHNLTATLEITSDLHLTGAGLSQSDGSVITYAGPVIEVRGASFTMEGIRAVCTTTTGAANVLHAHDAALELRESYFGGANRSGSSGGNGMYLSGATTGLVYACVCTKNDHHGIGVEDQADVTLEVNTCITNGSCGIFFADEASGEIRTNYCSWNGQGISVKEQADVIIEDNTCNENTDGGITMFGDATVTIRRNECSENGMHGICVLDRSSATVEDNTCSSNKQAGICFFDTSRGTVRRNECVGNRFGIYVDATASPTIGTNNLHGNTVNPQLYDTRLM